MSNLVHTLPRHVTDIVSDGLVAAFGRGNGSNALVLHVVHATEARPLLAARQSQNSQNGYGYMVMNNTVIEEC